MICKDLDRVLTAIQIVVSMFEKHNNGQQFIIMGFVMGFHIDYLLWPKSYGMPAGVISACVPKWLWKDVCEHKAEGVDFQLDR